LGIGSWPWRASTECYTNRVGKRGRRSETTKRPNVQSSTPTSTSRPRRTWCVGPAGAILSIVSKGVEWTQGGGEECGECGGQRADSAVFAETEAVRASHTKPVTPRPLNLKNANERAGERVRAVPFSFPIDSVLSSCRVVSSVSWERHLSHAHKQMDGGGGGGERVGAVSE
jgi:hypothetical protein